MHSFLWPDVTLAALVMVGQSPYSAHKDWAVLSFILVNNKQNQLAGSDTFHTMFVSHIEIKHKPSSIASWHIFRRCFAGDYSYKQHVLPLRKLKLHLLSK